MLPLFLSVQAYAQTKTRQDSATIARQHILDSTRAAQKHFLDSSRASRMHALDSMKKIRERRTDSLARIRKYRESKKFKDSVARYRQARLDSVKLVRTRALDSMRAERKRVLDSAMAVRKASIDSMRAIQKHRSDSLAVIRKYRESKRYKDSVAVVRQMRTDSLKAERKAFNDSVATARKQYNDSVATVRKATLDSAMAVRKVFTDSLKAVRKARTDSLAKVKAERDKLKKIREKDKEEKMQLALEMKIKKKQEAWNNEKMLKKKWSTPRKVLQNTFTRYNYYFNADKRMDEALVNMQRFRKEDYDAELALFPFDPDRDSSVLAPDMDSIIQKASVGIQIHDPRTKWADDLYLLLGQAYYYKGDYKNAGNAFRYIVSLKDKYKKNNKRTYTSSKSSTKGPSIAQAEDKSFFDFLKHQTAHNEALLWLARTYTEAHDEGNAESVIDLLESDPNMPQSLKGRLALEKAYVMLEQGNKKDATTQLSIVSGDSEMPEWIRRRAAYLNGQLLQQEGEYKQAAQSFDQVLALNPKIDMDFYARRNMTYNLMESGESQEHSIASLKKVLNDGKYAPYYEQVYYMIGRLAANQGNNKEAISYLNKSIATPKSTSKQKAMTFATLGNVYYDMHEYMNAKAAYDSAALFASSAPNDASVQTAVRRGTVLSYVTSPAMSIRVADSLLHLASLSKKDQQSIVRKQIRKLEQERTDSIFKAENAGMQGAIQQQANAAAGGNTPAGGGWYFSNPALMQQGYNEFKRKWGSRPLSDNWRRGSGGNFAGNANNDAAGDNDEEETGLDANGIPTEASLLAYIPNAAEEKDKLHSRNMEAYMNVARAYLNQLEDYPQVGPTLDTLEKRYPKHPNKAEAVYLRYMAAVKQNKLEEAQKYNTQLLRDYADTKWAALVRPAEDGSNLNNAPVAGVAEYYDASYGLLMQHQYTEVLQRMKTAYKEYNDPTYRKRFNIVEAIALAGAGEYDRADSMLTGFLKNNPTDSLRPWAETTLAYIKKNRPATPPSAIAAAAAPAVPAVPAANNAAGKGIDSTAVTGNATAIAPAANQPASKVPQSFTYKPADEHYVIFTFSEMGQRAMGVKAGITDFNTFRFSAQGLTTNILMVNNNLGIIVTQSFKNAAQAKIYMNILKGTSQIFREYQSSEYNIMLISADNYRKMIADKDMLSYFKFYKANYK